MGHVDEAGPRRHRRLHLAFLILVGITAVAAIALLALLAHSRWSAVTATRKPPPQAEGATITEADPQREARLSHAVRRQGRADRG